MGLIILIIVLLLLFGAEGFTSTEAAGGDPRGETPMLTGGQPLAIISVVVPGLCESIGGLFSLCCRVRLAGRGKRLFEHGLNFNNFNRRCWHWDSAA